jgi:hypothetical protein
MPVAEQLTCFVRTAVVVILAAVALPVRGVGQALPSVTHRIGVLDGDEAEVFGLIEDAVILGGGSWLVLDSRQQELRLFSAADRSLLQRLGGPGRGPGEFFVPTAVDGWPDGAAVLDRGNARISFYTFGSDSLLVFEGDVRIGVQAWDFCTVGRRIFLASDAWDTPVLEIREDGTVLNRFGSAPRGSSLPLDAPLALVESLAHRSRTGVLDCSGAGLTWVSRLTGELQHFQLDGKLVLRSQLPGYSGYLPEYTVRRTLRFGPADGVSYVDTALEVVHDGSGRVWIQAQRRDYGNRTLSRLTFELDVSTGVVFEHRGGWPRIHDLREGLALASLEEPFPELLILDVTSVSTESEKRGNE